MRSNRLAGHGLVAEGRAMRTCGEGYGVLTVLGMHYCYAAGPGGAGVCSCGAFSDFMPSAAARRRWHNAHKDEERRLIAANLAADRADPHDHLGRTPEDDWLKD